LRASSNARDVKPGVPGYHQGEHGRADAVRRLVFGLYALLTVGRLAVAIIVGLSGQ